MKKYLFGLGAMLFGAGLILKSLVEVSTSKPSSTLVVHTRTLVRTCG
jgi:hypothetical protein